MKKTLVFICAMIAMTSILFAQNVKTLDGNSVPINELIVKGKPTIIMTFAVWNRPGLRFVNEMAEYCNGISKYSANIIAIAVETRGRSVSISIGWENWPFKVYVCEDNSIIKYLDNLFGQTGSPVNMVYCCEKNKDNQIMPKWGIIGLTSNGAYVKNKINGSTTVDFDKYDDVRFNDTFCMVKKNGYWGVIDEIGKSIIPLQYDSIRFLDNYFCVKKNNKWGVLNNTGNTIVPLQYDEIDYSTGYFMVKVNKKYGILNKQGNSVIPVAYDYIDGNSMDAISAGYFIAKKDGKYGCLDSQNRTIVNFAYNELNYLGNDLFEAKKDKYGVIMIGKGEITKFNASAIEYAPVFSTKKIAMLVEDVWVAINIDGGCVVAGMVNKSSNKTEDMGIMLLAKVVKEGFDNVKCSEVDDKFLLMHFYEYTGEK